jgi:hypothetical protein
MPHPVTFGEGVHGGVSGGPGRACWRFIYEPHGPQPFEAGAGAGAGAAAAP